MRRFLLFLGIFLTPMVASAQTISVRDIIELSKAGLDEQVLIALVEVNPTVFHMDVETLKRLKTAGVAPNVITAMIKTGRTPPPPVPSHLESMQEPEPAMPQQRAVPQVVVIEHRDEPQVREVPVAVPVYVAVPVRRSRHGDDVSRPPAPRPPKAEPVYWGWGGKLRPDAWKPAIEPQKDAKIQIQKK